LSSQYTVKPMNSPRKITSRGGVAAWSIVTGAFIYAGISKHGPLLAYLNVSGYLYLLLACLIAYKSNNVLNEKGRKAAQHTNSSWKRIQVFRPALLAVLIIPLVYALFLVQPDKLAIAFMMGIPIEALNPCSSRPLDPETERIAREIFRLREIDQFDDGYCNQ